jgi:hypothetical protein
LCLPKSATTTAYSRDFWWGETSTLFVLYLEFLVVEDFVAGNFRSFSSNQRFQLRLAAPIDVVIPFKRRSKWMNIPFTGGCMCGAMRYECTVAPLFMGNCHCRDCQRATGSAFAAGMLVPRDAVTIVGDVKYYDVIGDSGSVVGRGFCPNCGSRVLSKPPISGLLGITAGSLDDPSKFQPGMDLYTDSAQPWDYMNPELPKFAKMPPPQKHQMEEAEFGIRLSWEYSLRNESGQMIWCVTANHPDTLFTDQGN